MRTYPGNILPSPEDIRAARNYLGWSQKQLGEKCELTGTAIANIENRKHRASLKNIEKLNSVFWEADIEFLPQGGFKPRTDLVTVLEGDDCYLQLLDDVYHTCREGGLEVLYVGADERKSPVDVIESKRRLIKAGIPSRYLIEEDNYYILGPLKEYRWIKKEFFTVNDVTAVYGNKIAFVTISSSLKRIIILRDQHISDNYRRLFNFMWRAALQPERTEAEISY